MCDWSLRREQRASRKGIMAEKFEELIKDMNVHEVECIWRILNKKKFIPTHSVVRLKNTFKDKEKTLKKPQRTDR